MAYVIAAIVMPLSVLKVIPLLHAFSKCDIFAHVLLFIYLFISVATFMFDICIQINIYLLTPGW